MNPLYNFWVTPVPDIKDVTTWRWRVTRRESVTVRVLFVNYLQRNYLDVL